MKNVNLDIMNESDEEPSSSLISKLFKVYMSYNNPIL